MKRMRFDFDFEDNELFDEQTEKVIKAKVREVVRKENYSIITEETNNEFNRLMQKGKDSYYSEMTNIIKKRVEYIVRDIVERPEYRNEINNRIEETVGKMIDIKVKTLDSAINNAVKVAVNEIINAAVTEKLSKIFDAVGEKDEK